MKHLIYLLLIFNLYSFSQENVSVMSYNIRLGLVDDGENHWNIRKEKVTDLMNYYEADFIGLQEVQQMQLDYFLQQMPEYAYIGEPRESGEWAEYSCILYKKADYKLLEQKTFWLSETPDTLSKGWDAACYRIATYGLFQNLKTKQKIYVFNTHLDHMGKTARIESAKLLIKTINALQTENNFPIILTGDFNATDNEETIQLLEEEFMEARSHCKTKPYGDKDTWNGFNFNEKPNGQIDYIFIVPPNNKSVEVVKYRTITDSYDNKYPSDHLPILAEVIIRK